MPKRRRSAKKRSASALSPGASPEAQKRSKVADVGSASKRRHLSTPSKSPRDEHEPAHATEQKAAGEAPQKFEQDVSRSATAPQATMTGANWNYDDDDQTCGPHCWPGQINGKQQSPIDLRLSKMKIITLKEPIQFVHYDKPLSGEFLNTGHSVQFIPDTQGENCPQIKGGMLDQTYKFIQYHYHWAQENSEGSEHALCGLRYPAELHLVHQGVDDPSKLAVLGIFLHLGDEHTALGPDCKVFPEIVECGQKVRCKSPVLLETKLPECKASFARYNGSLTTPPCSENVIWTVFTEPVQVTHEQLDVLRAIKDYRGTIIRKNYRPLQSVNDRSVFLASC
ncbi:Alpha carbonic anhydrase domain-containing protein [Aphelenchoides bicaudatus]|nr:Alpha carbonic anhydrase domain-containing protein [Aphelenchoides bicaudatus]